MNALQANRFATYLNDIFRGYFGRLVVNPDVVLKSEGGGKGTELYEDLLRDSQVYATLSTLKLSIVGREWEVIPASESSRDQEIAGFVESNLREIAFDYARINLLDGVVLGYKPAEIMWKQSGGNIKIEGIDALKSSRFVFDIDGSLRMRTPSSYMEGVPVPDKKFVVFVMPSSVGSPYGDAVGQRLYWPVWFKKHAIKFWVIFAERFASPIPMGTHPVGMETADVDKFFEALKGMQKDSVLVKAENVDVSLLDGSRSATIDIYERLCEFMNAEISKVNLGQTLTTDIGDKGSYAAANTHKDILTLRAKSISDLLHETINNTAIRWLVDYNFPNVEAYPKVWVRFDDAVDLYQLAQRDTLLVEKASLAIDPRYFYNTYGIPTPEPQTAQGHFSENPPGGKQADMDALIDRAISMTDIDMDKIDKIVQGAVDYPDMTAKLREAFGSTNLMQFRYILEKALLVASIAGKSLK